MCEPCGDPDLNKPTVDNSFMKQGNFDIDWIHDDNKEFLLSVLVVS